MKELAQAIVALQSDLKPVKKNATNPFFKSKYSDLPTVMNMVQPLLEKHKLAVIQFVTNLDGQSALKTMLVHESGESIESEPMPLILPKEDPQAQGSAITYARRYSIQALLGIVADTDDDGQKAVESINKSGAISSNKPRFATMKQVELMINKAKWGLNTFDKDEILNWLNNVLGKDLTKIEMGEVDDALEKIDKALREEKVSDKVNKTVPDQVFELTPEQIEHGIQNLDDLPG